jgi:chromatin segregation and condensation protein Rec8/ScpA/Scc1 (kleisin family)
VTFLAMLEMTRLKMIRIHQPAPEGEIYVSPAAQADAADLAAKLALAKAADEGFSG